MKEKKILRLTRSSNRKNKKLQSQKYKRDAFYQNFEQTDPQMTSSMALYNLHHYLKVNRKVNPLEFRQKAIGKLKICKICDKWEELNNIISCFVCEDNYHKNCYNTKKQYVQGQFMCNECVNRQIPLKKCFKCDSIISKKSTIISCQYCSHEFHRNCLTSIQKICQKCLKLRKSIERRNKIKLIKKEDKYQPKIKQSNRNLRDMFKLIQNKKAQIVLNSDTRVKRVGCAFKAMTMLNDNHKKITKYKNHLLEVIKSKDMNYTQDLKFIEFHTQHMEETSMNFGLQNMSPRQEQQYLMYKDQPIGPYVFQQSKQKGYGVIADEDIPKYSIICEYVGEVLTLRECSKHELVDINDSKMDLWIGRNAEEKLVIRPERWTNIARFINGTKTNHSRRNIDTVLLCLRGLPVILLIARQNIKKGQSLCYDYNAGDISAKYDTSHFV